MTRGFFTSEKYTPEIIVNSPEQHKEDIEKQLGQLQVLFCDRLYQQYKDECKNNHKPIDKTFSDILEEHGARYAGDFRMLVIMRSTKNLSEEEQDNLVEEKYYKNIDKLYNELPGGKIDDNSSEYIKSRIGELNILIDYLESEVKKAKNELPDKWREMTELPKNENGQIENMAGLIVFNSLKEYNTPEIRQIETALEKVGFLKSEDFLEIHLPAQYGDKEISPETITESLACLAKKIVDKYPKIRAVVTVSWLLDHPKFKQLFMMNEIGEAGNNWGQFIGSNRQIKQERVKELFSTGKMPYRNLIGYISVERFLEKYLPKK
jgi:hypothetical protein